MACDCRKCLAMRWRDYRVYALTALGVLSVVALSAAAVYACASKVSALLAR